MSYVLNKNLAAYIPVRFFFFFHCRSFSLYWPLAFLITFSHQRNKISIVLLSKFVSFGFLFVFLLVFYIWLLFFFVLSTSA